MYSFEDSLYNDIYSALIYVVPAHADKATKAVLDLLRNRDVLFADGDIFPVSNYMIGDERATLWFPDVDDRHLDDAYGENDSDPYDAYYDYVEEDEDF